MGVRGDDGRAFPGAEGFGAKSKGGEGGRIIWVTNLNSDGPESLREAAETPGPRIIKFKVAGTIELGRHGLWIGRPFRSTYKKLKREGKSEEAIENPYSYVTIDGRSAPGKGITLSGVLDISPYATRHVIVRHLRIRDNGLAPRSQSDCLPVHGSHVLIDHCSLQWARDEIAGAWYPTAHDITYQWCIIGPGWGPHSCGFLTGQGTDRITVHHCLFAHNHGRNPLLCGNSRKNWLGKFSNDTPVFDFRNNVVYNWYSAAAISAGAHVNMVGNLYLAGPESATTFTIFPYCKDRTKPTALYLEGNISPGRPNNDLDEWADAGHSGYPDRGPKKWTHWPGPHKWGQRRGTPFPAAPVVTHTTGEAKALVLSQVGAWPRDPVDAGIVRTVLHGTGHIRVKQTRPSDFTNARPSAKAAARAADAARPLTVHFVGEGQDTDDRIVMSTWDFGDGLRAVGREVTHTYGSPGEYEARLYVVDDRGLSGTATLKVSVDKDGFSAIPVRPAPATPAPEPTRQRWDPPTVALAPALAAPPTESDWQKAQRLTPFIDQMTWKKVADGEADARILHDADTLYLRLACVLRLPSLKLVKPTDGLVSRGGGSYAGYVKVMTFISPQHGRAPWYRFDVDLDGRCYNARGPDCEWKPSPSWRFASKTVDGRWQLTLAIPFEAVQAAPRRGSVLGLKFILNLAKSVMPIWPPVGAVGDGTYCVPHTSDPVHYARLRFP